MVWFLHLIIVGVPIMKGGLIMGKGMGGKLPGKKNKRNDSDSDDAIEDARSQFNMMFLGNGGKTPAATPMNTQVKPYF